MKPEIVQRLRPFGAYRVIEANEPAAEILEELLANPVPYLVIRSQAQSQVNWLLVAVDDTLLAKLAAAPALPVGSALELAQVRLPAPKGVTRGDWPEQLHAVDLGALRADMAMAALEVAAPAALTATLYPRIEASKQAVAPDDVVELAVRLEREAPSGAAAVLDLHFAPGEEHVAIHASVSSEAFAMPEGTSWLAELKVARDLSVTPSVWQFKARAVGHRPRYDLRVTFLARGRVLGGIVLTLPSAGTALPATTSPPRPLSIPPAEATPALMLCISEQGETRRGMSVLRGDEVLVNNVDWLMRADAGLDYFHRLEQAENVEQIEELGIDLRVSMPDEVQRLLEATADDASPLVISGDAPYAPFEVTWVVRGTAGDFLGARRPVLRWTGCQQHPAASRAPLADVLCIRPQYGGNEHLASAEQEEKFLQSRLPALRQAGTRDELEQLLKDDTIHAIHFAGHSQVGPALLKLGSEPLQGAFFRPESPLMARGRPFFFLNGCHAGTGRVAVPAAQANLVKTLLKNGAQGVIAPAIEIFSPAAREVAQLFYERVEQRDSVGDALLHVRRAARTATAQHAGTYLSYLAFASPQLRLTWPAPG
jgi:CHAT domain